MTYTCWRCRAEAARTARDCASCGKPLAPVPWLRRLLGPGRRAPDVVVADYARRVDPILSGLMLVVYVGILVLGAYGMRVASQNLAKDALYENSVRHSVASRNADDATRDLVDSLMEFRTDSLEFASSAGFLFIVLGVVGVGEVLRSHRRIRRLLLAMQPSQG